MPVKRRRGGRGSGGIASSSAACCSSLRLNLSSLVTFTITNVLLLLTPAAALSEKEVLDHLYTSLNGDNWDRPWDTSSSDICNDSKYNGVTCTSEGRVSELNLADNNMAGAISPYLYTMPYLKRIDFSKNQITSAGWDKIDDVFASDDLLANIEVIDLTNNLINTVDGVSKLKDTLSGLHMTYNNLKGDMPPELFELTQLEILAISENELSGKIDTKLGDLTNLLEFYCYGNKITGTIPSEVGKLTKMQIITFAENKLSGPLPREINRMGNLQTFSVHNNDPDTGNHTGPLPSFDTHPYLNEIYLDGNSFTGELPRNFLHAFNGTAGETVTLGLSNNKLSGTVPVEFLKFDSLVLNIVGNDITELNPKMCAMDSFGECCVASEDIGGWMNGLVQIYGCDAILCPVGSWSDAGRQEDDESPCKECEAGTDGKMGASKCASDEGSGLSQLETLAEFYLTLGGPQWGEQKGWEVFIDMESLLDLTLPAYDESEFDFCTNKFKGLVCDEDGNVIEISLPNNGLEGIVPSSLWDLDTLEELDLSGNEVRLDHDFGFGDMGNAVALRKVDLSSNDIQSFNGLGRATSLEELYVDDAYFFSSLGTELYQLEGLKILHMQYSGLKGKIPQGLSGLKMLRALNLYGNELTGQIPTEIGLMTKLWHIDFSENDFTGHLPTVAIKNLPALQKFHVHQSGRTGNGIEGKLPAFREQTKLHLLDLNSNQLTGTIPGGFLGGVEDTDQLMEIDIGYNLLTGTVPSTLSRFTNMRFDAVKNQITEIDPIICDATINIRGWFNGEVGQVMDESGEGCDAILCPVGTYNDYGRAQGGENGGCLPCPSNIYMGQTGCEAEGTNGDSVIGELDADGDGVIDDTDNLEKKILDKLYFTTGGPSWTKGQDTWTYGAVCDYEGITCVEDLGADDDQNINGGVMEINLAGFNITGNIPTEIYQLPSLKKLDVSNNIVDLSFQGIAQADLLETIKMNDADLTDLTGIGMAPSLKKLHISRNSFPEGDIPDELYSIATLESLQISYNGFEGSISPNIADLSNLKEFWAGSNDITGSIPEEMAQLSQLESLILSGNRMSGSIPNELENISTLHQLHLNGQRDFGGFTGPLPSFKENMHLGDIDLSKNSLTGDIPNDFLEALRMSPSHDDYAYDKIDLSSNRITGGIPNDWDDFVGIFANLANNRITDVPGVLCDDDDEFMDGLVGELSENKCDAILCPPGTFAPLGRQTAPDVPCKQCSGGTQDQRREQAPFYGSLKCKSVSEDRKILEQLHDLIFTSFSEDTYWMTDHPICSWYGITCDDDSADSGVTEIDLESNSLSTDDPDKASKLIFDLPLLEELNIRGNTDLPLTFANVGKPQNLEMLQLSATGLTSIEGLGNATRLKELHITENDIAGPFPKEIFNMPFMELLYISFNQFTGTLPTRIGELTGLREFYAYTNEFTGTLPTELGKLAGMENLVLGKNSFTGNIPTELNNLINLKEFSLYYGGDLSGPVLDFSNVEMIEKLDLEGNHFTGQLPSTFLSGLDPGYVATSDNEIIVHLADNALTGTLPESLANIKNLYLNIVGNRFKKVPQSFCQQADWMNGLVGELESPCHAIACPINMISDSGRSDGTETCTKCGNMESTPFIGSYSCSHSSLEINVLKSLYQATKGDQWEENKNWMDYTVPICSWYGIECAGDRLDNNTITGINLGDNSLDGSMPPEVFEMPFLRNLNLKENDLVMTFGNIGKAENLESLYISDIDLANIDGIGRAPALKELHLTANELRGKLPRDFWALSDTIEDLYIAYNSFTGTLSTEFGRMKNLVNFYAYDNEFTGSIPAEFASLPNLQNLVLAENKLSGTLSEDFSYMPKLTLFSAYRRLKPGPKLYGPLPSFSNVPKLEGLYLDYNHFAGTIPSNFLKSSLNTNLVTISHNLLSGKVPTELLLLDDLNIEIEGNRITDVDDRFCENPAWMNGLIEDYGCDAFMCEPGFHSVYGRQNTTDSACKKCDASTNPTPYWGSVSCDSEVDEQTVLELLYSACGGDNWHNNDNWLKTDDICTWYGVECRDSGAKTVHALRLGANNLVGTPPEELFRLQSLHTLWLHSNPLDFKFKGIGNAKNLIELRLDSTGLSSVAGVGQGTSLIKLDLKYNQIRGRFPMELLDLEKLESLSLTDNSMTGEMPNSFGDLSNLQSLRLGSNMFSGELKPFNDLKNLLHLDLSDNDLVDDIPKSFLDSISARKPIEVDLSSNRLTGGVPIELDRLDQLVIYLRDNKLTELDGSLCNSDNQGWNLRGVKMFGCDAIMCPPGTANFHGRQSSGNEPCLKCDSNTDLYGQITCNGLPLEASSSSRIVQGVVVTLISSFVVGVALLL